MTDYALPYCKNRLFEWTMARVLLGVGVWLLVWPTAMSDSSFRFIYDAFGPVFLLLLYLGFGAFRAVALYANGRWYPWGPRIRAIGAIGGALIWLQMAVALLVLALQTGVPPSVGIVVYGLLAHAEFKSTMRARADANRPLR